MGDMLIGIKQRKSSWYILTGIFFLSLIFWNILPDPLFKDPCSTVVYDSDGDLLGARIAADGQWRFPVPDSVPRKYELCLIQFEDKYFYSHPGVNPVSLFRALISNIKAREIVSGGSTLSMQVIRLSRKGKKRKIREKLIEIVLAARMELQYSKKEILRLYAGNAPFGGNVVGLETAAWRYFERAPDNLSWAESAMLAVLPNSPALIHPGKNRQLLKQKRDRLLFHIYERGLMNEQDYKLSILEEIPEKPEPLPDEAYHLVQYFEKTKRGQKIYSGINRNLQEKVNQILEIHKKRLYSNQIHNAACLVADVHSGEIIAYAGNIRNSNHPEYGGDVDVVRAGRSSGSILKPFLYAEMQYRGELLPHTLIPDIPTRYGGYSPKNYNREYEGIVTASGSLARSLNVPSVRMLKQYGTGRFLDDLKEFGFSTLKYSGEHYGLSLILGGAEVSLWDLTRVYTSFSRVLNSFNENQGDYYSTDWDDLKLENNETEGNTETGLEQGKMGAGAIWLCYNALQRVNRPDSESGWQLFSSPRRVAWKTGTSFGFRDGWAIACTPEYTVAVWTGNANGEGRPGLTGINAAAPVLFEVLNSLPQTTWFDIPYDDLVKTVVCRQSGHKAGRFCAETDSIWISPAGINTPVCPYHKLIHLDKSGSYRVNSDCYPVAAMKSAEWFVLPPAQEWYHIKKNSGYISLPPVGKNCTIEDEISQIQIIYPEPNSIIYIPRELSGEKGKVIFEAAHREAGMNIFWSLDDQFIETTHDFHQISLQASKGKHLLTLVDEKGERLQIKFEVLDR